MGHELRSGDAGIGLGSHDLGVADYAARLYHRRLFPLLVFSGAMSPTTAHRFPRGEAIHYRDRAVELGVPASSILVEPSATNTGENVEYARAVLTDRGARVDSVVLISKPYMERRAFATCRKLWPEVDVICASEPLEFDDYVTTIGDPRLVLEMVVGDLQRVIEYPRMGYAIDQQVPEGVLAAYRRLIDAGFTSRLMQT